MKKNLLVPLVLLGLFINAHAAERNFKHPLYNDSSSRPVVIPNLRIGDIAPLIKARWVKGNVITNYKKGMVYVLEFWATWCGPCKKAMPHISDLSKKHAGKAVIIGVNVWERPPVGKTLNQTVDDFVKGNTEKMTYNVCMDGADGYMAKNFVEAAAQPGIPATMIIDKEGKLVWIGHPESMDIPLQQIIDGTFDVAAFKVQMDAIQQPAFDQQKQAEALANAINPLVEAAAAKNYAAVVTEYNLLMANHAKIVTGEYYKYVTHQYYKAMLNVNKEKAFAEGLKYRDSIPNAAIIADAFALHQGLDKKFYQYSLDYYAKQKEDVFDLPAIAAANFNSGNVTRAIQLQEKWIESTKKFSSRPNAASSIAAANQLKKYKAALLPQAQKPKKTVKRSSPVTSATRAYALKTNADSLSYAIGMAVAKMYSKQGIKTIDAVTLNKGVQAILASQKPLLDDNQADIVILKTTNPAAAARVRNGAIFLLKNKSRPGVYTTSSGLQYEVIRTGTGIRPMATDTVEAHYAGALTDGTEFDSSYKRGEPTTFPLNAVIKGWTEGLQLMAEGAKYRLYIPHRLAYGTMDRGPEIPGGSVLIFDIELLKVMKAKK